jgi:hypothetical protein
MSGLILIRGSLGLDTRQRNHIDDSFDSSLPALGAVQQADDYRRQYNVAKHRPTFPCSTYNCHGLTFASRRTGIFDSAVIQKILVEDGYQKILAWRDVFPGDIVIYTSRVTNEMEHSGVVVEADPKNALSLRILSKWGSAHEVIHNIGDCPYDATSVAFYRIAR